MRAESYRAHLIYEVEPRELRAGFGRCEYKVATAVDTRGCEGSTPSNAEVEPTAG